MSELDGVGAWLERGGFPFEFKVAASFREAGFEVFQGIHYQADTSDAAGAREVDVLAVRQQLDPRHPPTRCTVIYVIECKTSDTPWVLFKGSGDGGKWEAAGRFPTKAMSEMDLIGALEWEQEPWLFRMPTNAGFRLAATWTGGRKGRLDEYGQKQQSRDPAFDAVRQATSAAAGILRGDPQHLPTIAIPVVAVSGSIFGVRFDAEGQKVEPITWERMLWRGDRSGEPLAIDVVAGNSVADYAALAWEGAGEFLPLLRAATLGKREDEQRRYEENLGRADRIATLVQVLAGTAGSAVSRARHAIASRLR